MALTGKYISSKEVINRVFRDNKYKYQLPWQDALEFIVECIGLIGAPAALQPKQACITIENYRGALPCDVHTITQVAGSFGGCIPFPMTTKTNSFHPVFTCADEQININLLAQAGVTTTITDPIGQDLAGNPVFTFQNGDSSLPVGTTDTRNGGSSNYPTYHLNDNFVFTNYQEGFVFLAYKGLPIDEDGFPLIPDNDRYIEAVKSFIRFKVDYILWRTGEITKDMFDYSEREWLFYVASAGNSARIPNYDGMQSLMNQLRLIPQKYSHSNFFSSLGD